MFQHPTNNEIGMYGFFLALIILTAMVLYAGIFYKKEMPKQQQLLDGNIIYQRDYLEKMIRRANTEAEIMKMDKMISEYYFRFLDNPDIHEFTQNLRTLLIVRTVFSRVSVSYSK